MDLLIQFFKWLEQEAIIQIDEVTAPILGQLLNIIPNFLHLTSTETAEGKEANKSQQQLMERALPINAH